MCCFSCDELEKDIHKTSKVHKAAIEARKRKDCQKDGKPMNKNQSLSYAWKTLHGTHDPKKYAKDCHPGELYFRRLTRTDILK